MKVWYVLMAFPVPSETFAGVEIAALHRRGVDVSAHAYGPKPRGAEAMIAERGLAEIPVTHGSLGAQLRGAWRCLARPGLVVDLLHFALAGAWRSPRHLAMSLALIPRTVDLYVEAQRRRPDVVHLYWGHYPSLLGHLLLKRQPDIVLSTSLSAYDLCAQYGGTAKVAPRAAFVRTWARDNVEAIRRLKAPPERIAVIYQGINLEMLARAAAVKKKVPRRILTAGRLIPAKGMKDSLAVFRRAAAQFPDASLTILGDGPQRGELERLARQWGLGERVRLLGHVPQEQAFREMAAAEVFLFLSRHPAERLPNVVKEAMACGCICIASDTPGIGELIEDQATGFIVPQGDVDAASERVLGLFSSAESLSAMRVQASEAVHRRFDADQVAGQLIDRWMAAKASAPDS